MSNSDILQVRIENHICLLTLNRPDARNALSSALSLAISEAVIEAATRNADLVVSAIVGAAGVEPPDGSTDA